MREILHLLIPPILASFVLQFWIFKLLLSIDSRSKFDTVIQCMTLSYI
jgi:hypothetical protein